MPNRLKRWNGTVWITIMDGDAYMPIGGGTATGNITAPTFTSSVAIGTPPFTVTSTTNVPNLNASFISGITLLGLLRGNVAATHTADTSAGAANITLQNSGVSTTEGGELKFQGQASKPSWSLDAYDIYFRLLEGSTQRLTIDNTGRMTLPPANSGQNLNLHIDANAGTSNRAAIGFGALASAWELGQDYDQDGGTEFYMHHPTAGQIFNVLTNGETYWNKPMIWPNAVTLFAKDTGGTNRIWCYPRWTDNCMYLDGGTGGMNIRTNNGSLVAIGITGGGAVNIKGMPVVSGKGGWLEMTTDVNGNGAIAHGCGFSPAVCLAVAGWHTSAASDPVQTVVVTGWDATNISVYVTETDDTAVASTTINIRWAALFFG